MSRSIEVAIDYHPSGRLTLKERESSEQAWTDVREGDLFGCTNPAVFYRAVANRLAAYAKSGVSVTHYRDTTSLEL